MSHTSRQSTIDAERPRFPIKNQRPKDCMRAHGVPNFPDPTTDPGGEGFASSQPVGGGPTTVSGITFSGPAFESVVKTCNGFASGSAPPAISESQKLGMIANARCLRKHGINIADPTFSNAGGANFRPIQPSSPALQRAAKACSHVGAPIPGIGFG
ncbi:MAG: hypothetical protein ACRDL5_00825 [Solirubrobacteraceae bacterium]